MRLAGRDKKERTRLDGVALRAVKEQPLPARDKIDFVSRMGLLRIMTNRRI